MAAGGVALSARELVSEVSQRKAAEMQGAERDMRTANGGTKGD